MEGNSSVSTGSSARPGGYWINLKNRNTGNLGEIGRQAEGWEIAFGRVVV
jgi:hypothetical protein